MPEALYTWRFRRVGGRGSTGTLALRESRSGH
jgi:hypothetical protein